MNDSHGGLTVTSLLGEKLTCKPSQEAQKVENPTAETGSCWLTNDTWNFLLDDHLMGKTKT
jgi:hypothetical protein